MAGETLSYWMGRIYEELGEDVGIVVMGDFNDEPFNRSIMEYALATSESRVVLNGRNPYLLNLMWPILAGGHGTHFFDGRWNFLDQIMINRGIISGKCGWLVKDGARIEAEDIMSNPDKPGPEKFGIKPNERNVAGYSDHFPVSLTLKKSS